MKTRNVIRKVKYYFAITIILAITISFSCTAQKNNTQVMDAYQLRMNGHADSAQVLLKKYTESNPDDALAWFELCRTTHHLGMANPRAIKETLDEALGYINTACSKDIKNTKYLAYKGRIETLKFYMALQMGEENASDYLLKMENTFQAVLQIEPSYYELKITLVEFFGGLPAILGGDLEKAEKYASELEKLDVIAGAKAREIMMDEDADYISYWKTIIEKNPGNIDAYQALGRVYLMSGEYKLAEAQYQKVIDMETDKNVLYLELGRYFIMQAMQNQSIIDSIAPLAEEQFHKFLNSAPEPINPLKAWTYGAMVMINKRIGEKGQAEEYMKKAKSLDPFFSPAFGRPYIGIFSPPEEIVHDQTYYLSPF